MLAITLTMTLFVVDVLIQSALAIPSKYLKKIVYFDSARSPAKRIRPNLDLKVTGAYREFVFKVKSSAEGFRLTGGEGDFKTPPIVVLGDSQTFGIGVDDEAAFSSVLRRQLALPVINTGCPGYNSYEELSLAKSVLEQSSIQPKAIVLAFFAGNDPYENYKYLRSLQPAPKEKKSEGFSLGAIKNFLVQNSAIYNSLIRLRKFETVNNFFLKWNLAKEEKPGELEIFSVPAGGSESEHWQATKSALEQIKKLSDEKGIALYLLFIPDRYQVDTAYWNAWVQKYKLQADAYDLDRPNRLLEEFSRVQGIPFFDATPALREAQSQGVSTYWAIDNHLSAAGHAVIGKKLSDFLKGKLA